MNLTTLAAFILPIIAIWVALFLLPPMVRKWKRQRSRRKWHERWDDFE